MQTIITTTDRISATDNLIFLVTDSKNLPEKNFSKEEYAYVKTSQKKHKKNTFVFNHFKRWIFVQFVEKERNTALRLENYRVAGAKLLGSLNNNKLHTVVVVDTEEKPKETLAFAEGMALANYQFLKYKNLT